MFKNLGEKRMFNILSSKIHLSDRDCFEYLSRKDWEQISVESVDGQMVKLVHLGIDHGKEFFYIDIAGRSNC